MWKPLHLDWQSEVVSEQPHLPPLLLSCDKDIITNNTIVQQTPDAEKQSHNYSRANSACLHAACRTVTETMNRDRRGGCAPLASLIFTSWFPCTFLFLPTLSSPILLTLSFSPSSLLLLHPDLLVSKSLFQKHTALSQRQERDRKVDE